MTRDDCLWQQSSNVLFGQSRNVLLTTPSWGDARRTTTDDTSRKRPADYAKEGEEAADEAASGGRRIEGQSPARTAPANATEARGGQVGDSRLEGETVAPADRGKHGERGGEDLVGGRVSRIRADVSVRVPARRAR